MESHIDFNISDVKKIIIYTRVSTKKQSDDEKHGLLSQGNICLHYAKTFYPHIKQIKNVCDIASSFNNKNALIYLDNEIDQLEYNTLILVSEASRIGRNASQAFQVLDKIRDNKSYIISVTEQICFGKTRNLDTRFKEKLIAAEESSVIAGDRQRNVIKYIRDNGGHWGKAPFGYKIERNENNIPILKENEEHQDVIKNIEKLVECEMTVAEITRYCEQRKLLNKKWNNGTVKKIVSNLGKKNVLDFNNKMKKITDDLGRVIVNKKK